MTPPGHSRGVIYFSSVPRNMRPVEVRSHFNTYGEILRMKFLPYPKRERRPGGPLLPLQFKEGWIEFSRQEDARQAANAMNAHPVECKRLRKCHGQLWTVKFLEGFSYDDIADEREAERRMRRLELASAQRYESGVNEAFRRAAMAASKGPMKRKREREEAVSSEAEQPKTRRKRKEEGKI